MSLTSTKLIRVGHSPDPDDAFMFYALAKEKIPMQGFRVEHVVEDIESLNQRALGGELEVTAVSCHAYAYLSDKYVVMRSGSSVGDKYGPILVKKSQGYRDIHKGVIASEAKQSQGIASSPAAPRNDGNISIQGKKIAVPGKLTTAYLALQLYDSLFEPVIIPFDQIFDAVESGKADLGLVIHEGQLSFEQRGFEKILDLGQWWFEKYKLPLPLGIDVIRRDLEPEMIQSFARLFKASIEYALKHRSEALDYAMQFGRGVSRNLGDQFVGMYVNDFTLELGPSGEQGLNMLLRQAFEKGLLPRLVTLDYV